MSAIQVANLIFESTGNNRIQYSGSNNINIVIAGNPGTSGQVLTSNGSSGMYWAAAAAGVNTVAQYVWTNTHTFQASILANTVNATSYTVGSNIVANTTQLTIGAGVAISVNGSVGTANQVLTSNGTGAYWASAGGSGATLNANNTDSGIYYIGLANTISGAWTNAVISNTKLYFVPSTGTLSATVFNSLSDSDYKINVETVNNALSIVSNLRGVTFNWIEDDRPSIGVIAQEVENVLPEIVTTHNGKKSVNYDGLIGVLIEAVKELKQEIHILKQEKTK